MNPFGNHAISRSLSAALALFALLSAHSSFSATPDSKFQQLDPYMEKLLKDWNAPGVGIGIVISNKLVFAKGYGFRDYEKKLPFTAKTLCPIASNTKLFTAVAAGFLVNEGKLEWDQPIHNSVPSIQFYSDELNNRVTLRDMLAHRTGITRHDSIWYKSDFTRKELFDRLRFLEPKEPMRQLYLYNNLMYAGVGYAIELKAGQTWEEVVRNRILRPLQMNSTVFDVSQMTNAPDFGVPFSEKRDSTEIHRIPYYEDIAGLAPAGALVSNIEDVSHWLIALMNDGMYEGQQALPANVLKATLEPAIALRNTRGEAFGWWEVLNTTYGMGRQTASYRGHLLASHGGALNGFYSQISYLPLDHIGVIVLVIGDHCASLTDIVSYNIYERLLDMDETPWSERQLGIRRKAKKAGTEARAKAGAQRVPDTKPSHPLEAYAGDYENVAYGVLKIGLKEGQLQFDFHKNRLPLNHFHYDRFDTPDDEIDGKFSVNFLTSPLGDIEKAAMSLDEAEVVFVKKPETLDRKTLEKLAGPYESPTGFKFRIVLNEDGTLSRLAPGVPDLKFNPYKGLTFRARDFSDLSFRFVIESGEVTQVTELSPSGEYTHKRRKE